MPAVFVLLLLPDRLTNTAHGEHDLLGGGNEEAVGVLIVKDVVTDSRVCHLLKKKRHVGLTVSPPAHFPELYETSQREIENRLTQTQSK